jgi:N,N'-diacetylchitobiose transport system permease protein
VIEPSVELREERSPTATGADVPAAEALLRPRRRGARTAGRRARSASAPYALLLPCVIVLAGVLAYPLYKLVDFSLQHYGLFDLIRHHGQYIGTANYRAILGDSQFWHVVVRTIVFTAVNVGLTMVLGTLIALLLERLGRAMRIAVTATLIFVWATPTIVAVDIFQWMVDFEFGVFNWLLTELHLGNFIHHDWFADSKQGFGVITALVVWGAIPFVTITVYAGLAQLPGELVEAARVDGANAWKVFRHITFAILKPIFVICTSLSIIWDFQVFNQVWVMLDTRPSEDYYLIGVYSFVQSFSTRQYGLGAAIAVVMVLMLLVVTFFYIRQMVRIGETA